MHGRLISVIILLTLATFAEAPASAQGHAGSPITGTVVDASGGVLVGAVVTIGRGADAREVVTNAAGRFAVEPATAESATLVVHFPGFSPATRTATPGTDLRIVLRPDGVSETITVGAAATTTGRATSATKTDTPLRDVPQAVSVVSRALMADQRAQSMTDVVRYMPGVGMAQGEGNRDAPILRGNTTTSDFFIDGVRDDVQYFRDVYNVERVEALKGPNAMIFGRGGVGGVINRVSRQADWTPAREVTAQVGSWNDRRLTADLGGAFGARTAGRLNAMYQTAESYRAGVSSTRFGVNPTLAVNLGRRTLVRAGYEYFEDDRTADRGIPSFAGRPVAVSPSTFFGDAALSTSNAAAHITGAVVEHRTGRLLVRSRASLAHYDKFYRNVFPGVTNADGSTVSLSAYDNATQRTNVFTQTDVITAARTGFVGHALLAGAEVGRQATSNLRQTGFFTSLGSNVTSVVVPVNAPSVSLPLTFRSNGNDADNDGVARVAALYAQDQIVLSPHVQAIVGVRAERFTVDVRNNRTATDLASRDILVSPRAGLVLKPVAQMSIYGSYSLAYLPRAGEQLASLSVTNQTLDPERFTNYEVGVKWDVVPSFAVTAATYRLDRSNVAVPDPTDPTRLWLVDGQRTEGLEVELSGSPVARWQLAGGYAWQNGRLTATQSATSRAGASLAMLPAHSFSLWNRIDLTHRLAVGLGVVHRGASFTSVDNTVQLPAYTRIDAGIYADLTRALRVQVNAENLLDATYYPSAHNNTNITPGAPRTLRLSLTTRF